MEVENEFVPDNCSWLDALARSAVALHTAGRFVHELLDASLGRAHVAKQTLFRLPSSKICLQPYATRDMQVLAGQWGHIHTYKYVSVYVRMCAYIYIYTSDKCTPCTNSDTSCLGLGPSMCEWHPCTDACFFAI